jgi:hypothetical protein
VIRPTFMSLEGSVTLLSSFLLLSKLALFATLKMYIMKRNTRWLGGEEVKQIFKAD